jgi:hypothetical protein
LLSWNFLKRGWAYNYNVVFAITILTLKGDERLQMKITRSSWDRWAPAFYLFIIGLAMGFGIGLAFGRFGGSDLTYFALVPAIVILIAFLALGAISKRIGKLP